MKKSIIPVSVAARAFLEEFGQDEYRSVKPVIRKIDKKVLDADLSMLRYIQLEMWKKGEVIDLPKWKDLIPYNVICEHCKEVLAIFKGSEADVNKGVGIHIISWHNDKNWFGCLGCNVNPKNGEVNFECCCGNKTIKHKGSIEINGKSKKNMPRYTQYFVQERK